MKKRNTQFSLTRRNTLTRGVAILTAVSGGLVFKAGEACAYSDAYNGPIVETAEGKLRGVRTDSLNIFKGIRYGEDTSGNRRFKPPVPVRPWSGVRDAQSLGSQCIQNNPDTPPFLDSTVPSEDCLFLNVWAPQCGRRLPVMVFFHGGAFTYGSGGAPMYDGAQLAERGDVSLGRINGVEVESESILEERDIRHDCDRFAQALIDGARDDDAAHRHTAREVQRHPTHVARDLADGFVRRLAALQLENYEVAIVVDGEKSIRLPLLVGYSQPADMPSE